MPSRASLAPRALVALLLLSVAPLTGCELLGSLLCDYESDPQCEDPERGQITGHITVPAAGAAQARGAVRAPLVERAIAALLAERADAPTETPQRAAEPPRAKRRAPRAGTAPERAWKRASEERWRPGEVIVRSRAPVRGDKVGLARHLEQFLADGTKVVVELCNTDTLCLAKLSDASGERLSELEVADVARRLARDERLAFAETNRVLEIARTPNDELYPIQWHYGAMRLPTAWNITVGHPDVVAAVVDTGILVDHPDLVGRVVGGADLISDTEVSNDGDGRDDDGFDDGDKACGGDCHSHHGTHVAGTMAANTDNARMVSGVSWEGQLLAVRVLGEGGGSIFDIVGGIYWAIGSDVDGVSTNPRPADVINLSLGGRGDSEAMNEAARAAVDAGALFIVAAGNDGADAADYTPANAPAAITVAAVGNIGGERTRPRRASYSNFGDVVDVAAPGGEQVEDVDDDGHPDGVLSTLGDDVEFYQGTSMASPHVAGLAMLMKALDPDLSQGTARSLLESTAITDVDCSGCGAGLVNAAQTLRAMRGEADQPLVVPLPDVTRIGRADLDAEVSFANEGGASTEVVVSVGGRDRAQVTLDTSRATLGPGESLDIHVDIGRTGEDAGEATLTAAWGTGQVAEARLFWSADVVNVARSVDVGALRIEGEDIIPERLVPASAADGYAYKLFNLTPGDYLVIGISDDDNDGNPELHEGIGVFPRIQEPALVTVQAGDTVEGTDFVVAPAFVYEDGGGAGDGPVGAACTTSADCQGGLYCESLFAGGYCTKDCSVGGDCPGGSECFCLEDDSGGCGYLICLDNCQGDADCREGEGYVCDVDSTCYPG